MSRLLTLLLMYRPSYDVGKYISLEKEIERTKETHYEALATSSQGWREGKNGYAPSSPTCSASSTPATESSPTGSLSWAPPADNEEAIRAFFDRLIGSATKREIMDANP